MGQQGIYNKDRGNEHLPNVSFIIAGSIQERHTMGGREKRTVKHFQKHQKYRHQPAFWGLANYSLLVTYGLLSVFM